MITETQAANAMGGKTARACDGCVRRRARWYCAADDAFLCQSCDTSVHSANQVASRHERVRLRTSSSSSSSSSSVLSLSPWSSSELKNNITTVWYEGFTRKARTPRNKKKCIKVDDDENSNNPLVPELESEEGSTFSLSFSSMEENDENSNCRVPVFDRFLEVEEVYHNKNETIDENYNFGLVPNMNTGEGDCNDDEKMDDELDGLLPSNFDLGDFAMDVESLLGEEYSCVDVKEKLGFLEFKDESVEINNNNNNNNSVMLKGVKNEEEEEEISMSKLDFRSSDFEGGRAEKEDDKCEVNEEYCCKDEKTHALKRITKRTFLRLDYEAVITAWDSHGSLWTTGCRPEFSLNDCWPECVLQGSMCPKHVLGSGSEETTAVGLMGSHQQGRQVASDGEREARVLRYKEKRRTRLFAKKIRYEVRKLNAEKRPRIKGRFVKRTSLLGTH